MQRCALPVTLRWASGLMALAAIPAAGASDSALEQRFTQTVRPFVTHYCIACHSGSSPAAQFDLKSYTTMDMVVRDNSRFALMADKLAAKQMPPPPMPQPPAELRQQVIDWIKAMRANEARKNAGDPGVVLARRLSNAEYNYSIRDLTGQDIQPTRQFPVDPANPEGFDNSGESLTMSPALLKKYLQAAREVANHMVLKPQGFDFAPNPMLVETDRDKYCIERIVNFYDSQPTDYADYFEAAWRYRHRSALGKSGASLAAIAAESKVSAKYLPLVWQLLDEPSKVAAEEVGPIAKLQAMWRALPAPDKNDPDAVKDAVRAQCIQMRDFVVRIRHDTAMQFAAPVVQGLPAASQPLLNWKLREFNSHRLDFDPASLRNDTDPPPVVPVIPKYPGLHREAAPRWAALVDKSRAGDPDLVVPAAKRSLYEASFRRFASIFPDAFYVKERGRYFPDDSEDKGRFLSAGYHNVMGYWRDDTPLMQLILDDNGQKELNELWDEFDFIADHTNRTWDQYYFNESGEVDGKGAESGRARPLDKKVNDPAVIFGLRDAYLAKAAANPRNSPVAAEAIRVHFQWVNDTLRRMERMRLDAEPSHLQALQQFAERAYRRPLSEAERNDLVAYYHSLRDKEGLTHQEAIRDSIVSILMSPDFLYRIDLLDTTDRGTAKGTPPVRPLSGYDLASRLSYFLWSSMPDEELLNHAASGDLEKTSVLLAQAHRMLKDDKARGLATEFGGNWLDFRHFEDINSVDRQRFPSFTNALKEAMFQEPIRMLQDVIRNDRSVLDMLYGNYTFVNPVLAKFYGMPDVSGDPDNWVRVDDAGRYHRGGLLPMAVFLTENSPGLRTSPVKRGHWFVQRVLGEVIPPPPPVVPELPNDEAKSELPLRDMLAQHRKNPVCASCHARFDVFGLAFEGYGPVGEARTKDLAGRPIDASAVFPGGSQGTGFEGVLEYIRQHRQGDYLDNLSRKLLSYALNRTLQLSDELTVQRMDTRLAANGYRFDSLIDAIIASPQFRNRRSADLRERTQSTNNDER
ncbi:MAG TPA: DUF1592 domain-containing protein [Bryobacteraceae bacterium]|nr:DUF1592 domain-containing protein [Bryobacteraceae bacterium]